MEKEKEDISVMKELAAVSVWKRNLLSGMLWTSFLLAIIALLFSNALSLGLFVLICFGIWWMARRWRRQFDAVMFPRSLFATIKASRVYRVYAAAMRREWSAILLLSNVFVVLWINPFDWFNPVLDLSEMDVYRGVIVDLHQGGRSNPWDYLWLRTVEGKVIKFVDTRDYAAYQYLKKLTNKDVVTVWSQLEWGLPPNVRSPHVWQLQHKDHFTSTYSKERVLHYRSIARTIEILGSLWTLFTLTIVWKRTSYKIAGEGDK